MSHPDVDIVDYIVAEHKKAALLLAQAKQSADVSIVRKVVECLSKHSFVEESLLYPILQDVLKDKDPASKSLHDHSEMKAALTQLLNVNPQNTIEFIGAMVHLTNLVHTHNTYEEANVLPLFHKCFNRDVLVRLGRLAKQLESLGPSVPDDTHASIKTPPKQIASEFHDVCELMKHAMTA